MLAILIHSIDTKRKQTVQVKALPNRSDVISDPGFNVGD